MKTQLITDIEVIMHDHSVEVQAFKYGLELYV
jgi:hypothetical protein